MHTLTLTHIHTHTHSQKHTHTHTNLQFLETNDRTVLISTDSRITLESLKNQKNHTYLIEKIRKKVIEMENQNWKIEFNWIKAHAGHHGNELADQTVKEAATNSDINECYERSQRV